MAGQTGYHDGLCVVVAARWAVRTGRLVCHRLKLNPNCTNFSHPFQTLFKAICYGRVHTSDLITVHTFVREIFLNRMLYKNSYRLND